MARKRKSDVIKIKQFIVELLINRASEIKNNNGNVSPNLICKLIKKELGFNVDIHTVSSYLKEDLSKYKNIIPVSDNENIRDLEIRINIAKSIAEDSNVKAGDRTKALSAYNALMNTKFKYEKMLEDNRLKQAEISRPIYKIVFGHFECTHKVCPKCKNIFFDNSDEQDTLLKKYYFKEDNEGIKDEKNTIQKEFKAEKGQSTFDSFKSKSKHNSK